MATLSVQTTARTGNGLEPVLGSANGGGDEFVNNGVEFVEIDNGDGSPVTITFETPQLVDTLAVDERVVVIPAGERRLVGPFSGSTYNDALSKVQITYSGVTSLTIGVFKLGAT